MEVKLISFRDAFLLGGSGLPIVMMMLDVSANGTRTAVEPDSVADIPSAFSWASPLRTAASDGDGRWLVACQVVFFPNEEISLKW